MGSKFRYSGNTEFQARVSVEPRRNVQFERKPSTRYARRQTHVLREQGQSDQSNILQCQVVQQRTQSCQTDTLKAARPMSTHLTNQTLGLPNLADKKELLHYASQPQINQTGPTQGSNTRSIMDIISEFNSRDREPDIDYLKWVSESKGSSHIKKNNIVTPTNSVRGLESEVEYSDGTGHEGRGSPDSGVMVAYSEEPKV